MSSVHNQEKRDLATYYRERGFSYSEIAKLCSVSKSTVSNWLRHDPVSQSVKERNSARARQDNAKRLRLINSVRKREQHKAKESAAANARNLYGSVAQEPLFIAGVMLANSASITDGVVRFSSSDPVQHKLWLRFLQRYIPAVIDQVRFQLVTYQNQDHVSCEKWWQKRLMLPSSQWYASQILAQGSATKPPLHFGVGSTIIASASLSIQLTYWQKELVRSLSR